LNATVALAGQLVKRRVLQIFKLLRDAPFEHAESELVRVVRRVNLLWAACRVFAKTSPQNKHFGE
jgi:hypothetical protein